MDPDVILPVAMCMDNRSLPGLDLPPFLHPHICPVTRHSEPFANRVVTGVPFFPSLQPLPWPRPSAVPPSTFVMAPQLVCVFSFLPLEHTLLIDSMLVFPRHWSGHRALTAIDY